LKSITIVSHFSLIVKRIRTAAIRDLRRKLCH